MYRYAVYFCPPAESDFWQLGSCWLGRDARTGLPLAQPAIDGITSQRQHLLTRIARRYGWHATVKAPFRLAEQVSETQLMVALEDFCGRQSTLMLNHLRADFFGDFLALNLTGNHPGLQALAQRCVSELDHFRAASNASELAHRMSKPLSDRQHQLLMRWGYPHTEEQYRFHMTLSDAVNTEEERASWLAAARQYWQGLAALKIDRLSLVGEATPGADFICLTEFRLGAPSPGGSNG